MATAPPLLSINEYLHTSYKPDVHFVDGEIEERNVGERPHSFIQGFITYLFTQNADAWRVDALVEQRIRIDSNRVRVCDVAVVSQDAPFEDVVTVPPLLCIEVLSPEDRLPRATRVLADYYALGVTNIWLIDPYKRLAFTFNGADLQSADITNLSVPGTPIQLDLTGPFAELDRRQSERR